jgi:hypothetical protein
VRTADTSLRRLIAWAQEVSSQGLASLSSYHGKNSERFTLLPRLKPDNAGLVTVWNDAGAAHLQLWRSVFERRAPRSLSVVEEHLGKRIGQGTTTREVNEELLSELTAAYREASGRREPTVG